MYRKDYNSVKNLECVKLRDRKVPLDYYICIKD